MIIAVIKAEGNGDNKHADAAEVLHLDGKESCASAIEIW